MLLFHYPDVIYMQNPEQNADRKLSYRRVPPHDGIQKSIISHLPLLREDAPTVHISNFNLKVSLHFFTPPEGQFHINLFMLDLAAGGLK